MNDHARPLIRRAAITVALLALLAPAGADAVVSNFSLNIPDRSPSFPVGRVRITLDLAGAAAGSTLTISGNVFNLNNLNQPIGVSGDFVRFAQGAGPNQVVIDLLPLSNLQGGTNFCVVAPAATFPDLWSLSLDGPAISGYRFTSYTAASNDQCGTVSCAQRRINNTPAVWVTPPPGSDLGRHPIDVILVLDESGSMGSIVAGSGGETKMALMKWAVGQFVDAWKLEATAVPEDRLGVIFFTTGTDAPLAPFFIVRGPGNPMPHPWDAVKTEVNGRSPQNLTAMGQGMQLAIDNWLGAAVQNDANVVVMTNGLQNVNPKIIPDVANPSLLALNGTPLVERCGITFQTIGIGAPATVQADLLDEIAAQTGGQTDVTVPDLMDITWRDTLLEVLKGDTLELVGEEIGELAVGELSSDLAVEINPSATQLMVLLAWRGRRFALDAEAIAPGGAGPAPVAQEADDPFYTVQTFELPAAGPDGTWTVRVRRNDDTVGADPIAYHLSVMAVESVFSYRADFDRTAYRAGDDIVLQVSASEGGVALTGLGSAISAEVLRPPGPLGTLLHRTQVPDDVFSEDPPGVHADQLSSPSARKLYHLIENQGLLDEITPRPAETLTLHDDGDPAHGDLRADDGVYSLRLADAETPGQYRFGISIDAMTAGSGHVVRHEDVTTEVRVGVADRDETEVDAAPLSIPGDWLVTVIPADRFGHFFGPDFEDLISITVAGGGTPVTPFADERANGSYTLRLTGVLGGADPTVKIDVEGETVADEPLSELSAARRQYALFAGLGFASPRGHFDRTHDSSGSIQLGFEWRPLNRLSLEAVAARDRFKGGAPDIADRDVDRLAVHAKWYLVLGTANLAVSAGPELFDIDDLGRRGGFGAGAVSEYRLTTRWSLEGALLLHRVTAGDDLRYVTGEAHVRYRF